MRQARSVCWMSGGSGADVVHAFKYSGWSALAEPMADQLARVNGVVDSKLKNALVPVPLARARERERGYNQSALLASALARRWRIPAWNAALERTRYTQTQTALTPQQRLTNVADAFSIMAAFRARVRNAHLILVDDVITTGATMNACAAAMFAAGARSVAYLTFGRARAPGDAPT